MATMTMTRNELTHIPAVPFTNTWFPVHHADVVKSLATVMDGKGIEPIHEDYEVSEDGLDLFGTWTLPADDRIGIKDNTIIGFRNSMKKRFSLGLVAGNRVIVCSNMCFDGDFVEHRRHTNGLTPAVLTEFIGKAADTVIDGSNKFRDWFEGLAEYRLNETNKRLLVYEAIDAGIIAPGKWSKLHGAYDEELSACDVGAETLMHFHGAVTRVLRESSLGASMDKTRKLNALCKAWGADDSYLLKAA